ncbi:hypothetical protein [Haloarcula nitratireducens]|uniref:Uncharacterized protein n=1 Tax=Haloarcula nitratireducens TaxID=2487749 RepID=A0AAW4PFX1_9EURY|nr:hypothetical protein [Halomicroarcula nitratireducens]MBX0296809.1 hypothetical protein [Halomicroarcula nitratireducens]
MAQKLASRLETFFKEKTDGDLRSIVQYEQGDFTVAYLRDDVAEQYTDDEFADAIDDSRFESFSAPIYDDLFSDEHGELTCLVKCFENVLEMNFVLADGVGTAVALEAEAFSETHGLVAEARDVVVEEREQLDETQDWD